MTIDYLRLFVIPAAYHFLPISMRSANATAMLIAIALQESKIAHRRQVRGPARGFWQFESGGGVKGVLSHPATAEHARTTLMALCYPKTVTVAEVHGVLEHNDALACVFARLLLWTVPDALPGPHEALVGWAQYLDAWRPGRPHPETWQDHYATAHMAVTGITSDRRRQQDT